jgi:hypothetical protein
MYVSITELIWQATTWEESIHEVLLFCFSIESLSTIQRLMKQFTIPMASTTWGQSLGIVSGFYSKKWGRNTTFNERPVEISRDVSCAIPRARLSCFSFSIDEAIVQLKYDRLFMTKTTWGLIVNIVWHVSTNFYGTFLIFRLPAVTALCANGLLNKTHQQTWGFWT